MIVLLQTDIPVPQKIRRFIPPMGAPRAGLDVNAPYNAMTMEETRV